MPLRRNNPRILPTAASFPGQVNGGVLEPSLTRLTGDVTFETAKDERERGKYQQESKSVWMTKIKHKFTFGGSLPSSIIRVSPFFTFAFSSVSSYELEKKKEQMTLALILSLLGCMTGSNDER